MMRPRTVILSCSALLALLYPLMMGQKERLVSSIPIIKSIAGWFWIIEPLLLTVLFFACAAVIRQNMIRYACIIAASCFLSFAAAEMYFILPRVKLTMDGEYHSQSSVYVQSGQATHLYEQSAHVQDPVLGYRPNPDAKRLAARCVKGEEVIYDVLYSRDEEGWRITPDRGDKADTAILLFGCSFTVGHGLNDRETFAWKLGEMLGEKFQVFNYGLTGYGSHHMLRLVESGRLDALVQRYKQIYAFFLTISDHPERCLGLRPFHRGPRYILENGIPKFAGMFSHTLDRLFAHSRVYDQVRQAYFRRLASHRAFNTHVAIVTKAMHELHARYHAHALTVVYPDFTRVEPALRDNGVRTLSLTEAMPDYAFASEKYAIKGDGHPNALANTRVAEALAEYILKHPLVTGERQ